MTTKILPFPGGRDLQHLPNNNGKPEDSDPGALFKPVFRFVQDPLDLDSPPDEEEGADHA